MREVVGDVLPYAGTMAVGQGLSSISWVCVSTKWYRELHSTCNQLPTRNSILIILVFLHVFFLVSTWCNHDFPPLLSPREGTKTALWW